RPLSGLPSIRYSQADCCVFIPEIVLCSSHPRPSDVQLPITQSAYHWSERDENPVTRTSGDDQLARRIVSMQAGPGGVGSGLGCQAGPPLRVFLTAPGRGVAAPSRRPPQ